jgi:predicted permease
MTLALAWELSQSTRRLWRRPGQTALALAVLGGGLAAFLFTMIMLDGLVRARPPYAELERIVNVSYAPTDNPRGRVWIALDETRELPAHLPAFDHMAAYTENPVALRDTAEAVRLSGALVGHQLFDVLGVAPVLGRRFLAADDTVGAPLVVLIGDALWRSRYASDPAIVGRAVHVDGRPATIVGVMPPRFTFPFGGDLWMPARLDDPALATDSFMLVGRLAGGATLADARGQMQRYFEYLATERRGAALATLVPAVTPLIEWLINPNTRYFIGLMLVCGAMVLLLAVSNGAYLLLAQVAQRHNEISTRSAVGGSSLRLGASLLLDAALTCAVATVLALGAARLAGAWLARRLDSAGDPLPPWMHLGLSGPVVAWALVVGAGVTGLVALAAIWRVRRLARAPQLRTGGTVGMSRQRTRLASVFTGSQVALACVLMLCAVVCLRMLVATLRLDTGMHADPARVLGAEIALPAGIDAAEALLRAQVVAERVRAEPGVASVALTSRFPGAYGGSVNITIEGEDWGENATRPALRMAVDEAFMGTAGVRLASGRAIDATDVAQARPVAVVDAEFAQAFLGGASPLGRRVMVNPNRPGAQWHTIVGVTTPVHLSSPDDLPAPDVLVPFAPLQERFFTLSAQTEADPSPLAARLPGLVGAVEPDAPVYWVRTYEQTFELGAGDVVLITQILGGLASLGLVLAAAGLYATLALAVTQRTREIGLRRAVGASTANVATAVARRSLFALGIGLVAGAAVGSPLAQGLAARGDSMGAFDALTVMAVVAIIGLAAALALLVPVRRAVRVHPMMALRDE